MGWILWLVIMLPVSALFTGLGIYALKSRKPMWFWSGTTVKENEITDIPAYNRANGIMWLCYSGIFWAGTILGLFQMPAAGILVAIGCLGGIPFLVFTYGKIYAKYKVKS